MNAFERFFAKVGHVIAWPFVHAGKVIEVLTVALKDEPAVKTAIVGLVEKIKQVAEDSALATAAKGLDIPEDMQAIEDAKELWAYVTGTFMPAVEAAYKDLDSAAVAPDPASVATAPGGLHTIAAA